MEVDPRAELAARNNADLYALVFDARGVPFLRTGSHLAAMDRPPPHYADVTVQRAGALAAVAAAVDAAMARSRGHVSVKDSFLEIDRPDLRCLFTASWTWRAPRVVSSGWERVRTPEDLAAWEAAWAITSPVSDQLFPDALLACSEMAFLARRQAGAIVAGCIANLSDGAVGLSNVFGADIAEAADAVSAFGSGQPVVGYEAGDALDQALAAGFMRVGDLRVLLAGA
ncbi:MAG: hypothetical protein AAF919_16990 [Pseudomonadota bacterium]